MNIAPLLTVATLRLFLVTTFAGICLGLGGCTTTDVSEDTTIYPTPAEKNQQMQEKMSQVTRSLM